MQKHHLLIIFIISALSTFIGGIASSTLSILFPNHHAIIFTVQIILIYYIIKKTIKIHRNTTKEIIKQNNKLIEELFIQQRGTK